MSSRTEWKRYSALLAALSHEGDKRSGMQDDASDVDSTQATCHVDSQYDKPMEESTIQFSRRPRSQSTSTQHRDRRPVPQEKLSVPQEKLFPVAQSKFSSSHGGSSPRSEMNEPAKRRKSPRAFQGETHLKAATSRPLSRESSQAKRLHSPVVPNASMKEITLRTSRSKSKSKSRSVTLEPDHTVSIRMKRNESQSKRRLSSLESETTVRTTRTRSKSQPKRRPAQPGVIVRTKRSEAQSKQVADLEGDSLTKAIKSEPKQLNEGTKHSVLTSRSESKPKERSLPLEPVKQPYEGKRSVRTSQSESKPKRRPSHLEPVKVITGSFQECDASSIALDASFETQRWIDEPSMSIECKLSNEDEQTTSTGTESPRVESDASTMNISPDKDSKRKEKSKKSDRVSFPKEELVMKTQHVRLFGHGRFWTIAALVMSFFGTLFSFLARRSTAFVRLAEPIDIAPIYYPVHETGMLRMEVCYNETMGAGEGCSILRLSTADIDDNMFNLARLLLTLGSMFGCFFSIFLTSAVFWESINLRVIGFGYMATYFVQSFSMLFFDTQICSEHDCKIGPGCAFCIIACLGWIGACIATAKMDAHKVRELRRRRRRERRRLRELRKTNAMIRKQSTATENTDASSESSQEIDIEVGDTGEVCHTTHCVS